VNQIRTLRRVTETKRGPEGPQRTPPPSCSTTPPIERSASVLLPPARAASLQQKQGNLPKAGARNGESSHKGAENPVQQPPTGDGGRSSGFHSSMPRSNPHARERVMDDRKHLDAIASSVAFAGHETSVASPAGSSRESVLHALANRIGDQEMLETLSSGGSPLTFFGRTRSSTRCARPVPAMESVCKDGESRHPHGSLSRPPVAIRSSGTGATANLPVVLLGGESHLGLATIRRRLPGPCACTACRSQRGTVLSKGSCSRSYRRGRSRTNGVVVVEARSNGRPELRDQAKRSEGQLSRRE